MSKTKATNPTQPAESLIEVRGQYLKDLSFENPRSLSLDPQGPQPNISVNVEAKAAHLSENTYEVVLQVRAEAIQNGQVIFLIELVYGGIFALNGIPNQSVEPILMIECPRLLFPFARNLVADLVREGGFPPLLLNPIDFAQLYQNQKKTD
jgi:preprotein translocase subunit SecB